MKWFLRIIIIVSIAGWMTAGWVWRDEIKARVVAWQGSPQGQEIAKGIEEGVGEAVDTIAERLNGGIEHVERTVILPEPIRARIQSQNSLLTVAGVAAETNAQRKQEGLPALKLNAALSRAALTKAQDMLARQYFAHDAPDGVGAADLIESAGYAYVTVGENLALGNYENDAALVQAWMDSPGHRENILNARYTEIGVGVVQGTYEGERTWMAVQEFGKPLSDCPAVEGGLQADIQRREAELNALGLRIEALKAELDRTRPHEPTTQAELDAYNAKVAEHNRLVAEHNRLRDALQGFISRYNTQVQAYNRCLQSG